MINSIKAQIMDIFSTTTFYLFTFLAVYIQVFFLVTFLENRRKIQIRTEKVNLKKYHGVTVIIPCWNEANTISKTVQSLIDINYPQDKLNIFLVDIKM
jgi:cellulose synthase/poly-beta-1,6-N-acetylglucosamine synthase-like glycosyltransferase